MSLEMAPVTGRPQAIEQCLSSGKMTAKSLQRVSSQNPVSFQFSNLPPCFRAIERSEREESDSIQLFRYPWNRQYNGPELLDDNRE